MVIEIQCLEKKVNNMLFETDWLNILVDEGENKVTSIKQAQVWFRSRMPEQSGTIMLLKGNSSRRRKRIYTATGLRATLFIS